MKSPMLTRGVVLTGALTLTHAVSALADGATRTAAPATGENTPINASSVPGATHVSGGGSSLVRTIVGLFIVIAVIYGIAWILRQVRGGRAAKTEGRGWPPWPASRSAPAARSQLVRAGQELVLLGVAEHGVTPIRRYTEEEARAAGFTLDPAEDDAVDEPRRGYAGAGGRRPAGGARAQLDDLGWPALPGRAAQRSTGCSTRSAG